MTCSNPKCGKLLSPRDRLVYGSRCEDCFAQGADRLLVTPPVRLLDREDSGLMSMRRKGRSPGVGDGQDQFGNHT